MKNTSGFNLDFVGIGAERSATTWIAKCLSQHPEICIPEKELFFFNEYDPHYLSVKNYRYAKGFGWFRSRFAACPKNSLKGEFSPTYLYDKKAAERIKQNFPHVKILVSLRDPVDRAYSQYVNDLRMGVIPKMGFKEALRKYPVYIEKGYYAKYLKYYFSLFPRENILIIFYDDIKMNPQKVIKNIYGFLNVSEADFKPPSVNQKENSSSVARFQWLNYFMMQTDYFLRKSKMDSILKLADEVGIRKFAMKVRDLNSRSSKGTSSFDPTTYRQLRKLFVKDLKDLKRLAGRGY